MANNENGELFQISTTYFEDEMKTSYLNYAYSVITARAIPDVRDGLKPVHRRILYDMAEMAMWHDKPTRKSARVVGDVLGKFHPHGDSSVYMAAVKLAQDFSIRYPMIIGQGNFGSIDDDPPAAMRYTEMKLSKVAEFMLDDLKKDTVDFRPNFDETLNEPVVLPGKFPNLLCNGTTGIAVGFATDIPPHNFSEVSRAIYAYIDNPKITVREILKYVPGPDFPTHGVITNKSEMEEIYTSGRGSIHLAGKMHEEESGSRRALVISEIPYRVIKSKLVEEITNLAFDNKNKFRLVLAGIKEVRDESNKEGIRVVINLNRDADAEAIKTVLYRFTSLTTRVKVNMVVLAKNQPRFVTIKDIIHHFVEHRREVIIRRTKFDLDKAEKELHILEGLLIALANIDEVINIIKTSKDVETARTRLMKTFKLSEIQAQAILDMRLQKLTNLETLKLKKRKDELVALIKELKSILESPKKRDSIIKDELSEMEKVIGDKRRTQFEEIEFSEIDKEELIKNDEMLLTVSRKGFVFREVGSGVIKAGSRGSRGHKGDVTDTDKLEEDDFIFATVAGNLKDTILFVTDVGKVYSVKGYEIKGDMDGKITRAHIRNIERLSEINSKGENINAVLLVSEFTENNYMIFLTRKGKIARISLSNFSNINRNGIIAMKLSAGDAVVSAVVTDGTQDVFMVKRNALGYKLNEKRIPVYNRGVGGAKASSVKGEEDELLGMGIAEEGKYVIFIAKDGRGRKVVPVNFNTYNRGARGYKIVDIGKSRILADFTVCEEGDLLLIITRHGRRISFCVDGIKPNQLLKLIELANKDDEVSTISRLSAPSVKNDGEGDA